MLDQEMHNEKETEREDQYENIHVSYKTFNSGIITYEKKIPWGTVLIHADWF